MKSLNLSVADEITKKNPQTETHFMNQLHGSLFMCLLKENCIVNIGLLMLVSYK